MKKRILLSALLVSDGYNVFAQNILPTTGSVGIGTTTPKYLFDVNGKANVNGQSWAAYGNLNMSGYSWTNAAFTTNSIEIVNNNGTVSNSSPTLTFHRYGTGGPQFRLAPDGTNVLFLESAGANSARNPLPYGGAANLYFKRFHVDADFTTTGNVGIGTSTPKYLLDVNGKTNVNGQSWAAYGNSNMSGYSWTNAAFTTNSIEIVNNNGTVSNSSPTLTFHRYGTGGPQFRLAPDGSNVLYLESAGENSSRSPMAYGGGGNLYFKRFQVDADLTAVGNIGIGTPNPTVPLDIISTNNTNLVSLTKNSIVGGEGPGMLFKNLVNDGTQPAIAKITSTLLNGGVGAVAGSLNFFTRNKSTEVLAMTIGQEGNVGIGTTNPENADGWDRTLEVHGKWHAKSMLSSTDIVAGTWVHELGYYGAPAGGIVGTSSNHPFSIIANKNVKMTFLPNGYVGIGTITPKEALSVNGNIRAKEVKVETANWPDYVFEEGYQKETLSDLERYIKANKHLPGIADAKTIAENGISISETIKAQQKIIEELTLHLIEKEKELKKLQDANATQERKNVATEVLMENLLKRITLLETNKK